MRNMMAAYSDPDFQPIPPTYSPGFDVLNFETGETVETFDTLEDAKEFLRIYPDARVCAILAIESDGSTCFVD